MAGDEVLIRLDLGLGDGTGEAFGCDLTEEYVRENSEYTHVSEIVVVKLGGTTLADQRQVLAEVARSPASGRSCSSTAAASG